MCVKVQWCGGFPYLHGLFHILHLCLSYIAESFGCILDVSWRFAVVELALLLSSLERPPEKRSCTGEGSIETLCRRYCVVDLCQKSLL